ncbi:hypothetical protein ES703_105136 [subsurface metagenome]
MQNKYIGIYYSDSYFKENRLFVSAQIFYDEIHIIFPIDIQKDMNEYIKTFKVPYNIHHIGKDDGSIDKQIKKMIDTIEFALKKRSLIGNCLNYHSHLLNEKINYLVNKIMSTGRIKYDELLNFMLGRDEETQIIRDFFDLIKTEGDEWQIKVSSTAYYKSKKNDWQLITDNSDTPIPQFSKTNLKVKQLTSILSEKCFEVLIPRCKEAAADEILEIRKKLSDVLIPYRLTLQKLTTEIRGALSEKVTIDEIKNEAQFIVESKIEPAVYELTKKIEQSNDKILIKIFGKVLGWIPIIASTFVAPTPDKLYTILKKTYSDIGSLSSDVFSEISRDHSLSFLISSEKMLTEGQNDG